VRGPYDDFRTFKRVTALRYGWRATTPANSSRVTAERYALHVSAYASS
jgi:hypothetical protein